MKPSRKVGRPVRLPAWTPAHAAVGELTGHQECDLRFGCGPPAKPRPFTSEAERQAAWDQHGDRLTALFRLGPGRRLQAWWDYRAGDLRWPGLERERSTLYEAGRLDVAERVALEAEWRREFNRAQSSDFWMCLGPGEVLEGAAARRALYAWADIPPELVKKWTSERRRRVRTVRRIEVMAGS
jgi:hypothetical protein